MKTMLSAVAIAASVATLSAPAAQAMDMEFNMLTGAVYNALKAQGFDTDKIDTLTLSEIAEINFILSDGDMEGGKRARINQILSE